MVQFQFRYFYLAFERIFSDIPLLRTSRHKVEIEKERKKKKKLASDYINAVLRTALKTRDEPQ